MAMAMGQAEITPTTGERRLILVKRDTFQTYQQAV